MAFSLSSCFPCLSARKTEVPASRPADPSSCYPSAARTFSLEELAAATNNFSDERVVGREASLYKGYLRSVNQVVAIKLQPAVDRDASADQRNRQFLTHVLTISELRHPNIINLIGFCADGDHTILVHEYMPLGFLEDHLHDPSPGKPPLDWNTRMNIAAGVARGLEYVHDKGVVYPCVSSSDILLGAGYHPKLSQYVLAERDRIAAETDKCRCVHTPSHVTIAPEILETGMSRRQTSVYGFGVILLEMITGQRTTDNDQDAVEDRDLLRWARTLLKDRSQFYQMADPALHGRYPSLDLHEPSKLLRCACTTIQP